LRQAVQRLRNVSELLRFGWRLPGEEEGEVEAACWFDALYELDELYEGFPAFFGGDFAELAGDFEEAAGEVLGGGWKGFGAEASVGELGSVQGSVGEEGHRLRNEGGGQQVGADAGRWEVAKGLDGFAEEAGGLERLGREDLLALEEGGGAGDLRWGLGR
jgi:hypothetical protein